MDGHIVVVGGGFAGFWASVAAKRVGDDRLRVSLVSREPALQMRPRLYEAQPETLQVPLLPLLDSIDVHFVAGVASDLDLASQSVLLSDGSSIGFDRLIVATGSVMSRPGIPGADQAYSVDTVDEAIAFDRRLAAVTTSVPHPVIAIIGAGFTGIELALEIRDRMTKLGNPVAADRARIFLIDQAEVVGPELGAGPRPQIEAALADARVELRLNASLVGLRNGTLDFARDQPIVADAVVMATGMRASDFARKVPGDADELGRIRVERSLRAPKAPEIFLAGDVAAADVGDGHTALQSCQHALRLGRCAGENAARDLLAMPLLEYSQPRYTTCLDLGRSGAVLTEGWERKVKFTGDEAKALKRHINTSIIYPPTSGPAELLAASAV